jgi:hypothetical protein
MSWGRYFIGIGALGKCLLVRPGRDMLRLVMHGASIAASTPANKTLNVSARRTLV